MIDAGTCFVDAHDEMFINERHGDLIWADPGEFEQIMRQIMEMSGVEIWRLDGFERGWRITADRPRPCITTLGRELA